MKLLSDKRKNSLILGVLSLIAGVSCFYGRTQSSANYTRQGISGQVLWVSGNRMPSPDSPLPSPKGVRCSVFVHQLTPESDVIRAEDARFFSKIATSLVKAFESDDMGNFTVALPEGEYSIFLGVDSLFYANISDQNGNITPVYVKKDSLTRVVLNLDYAAVY